jgi:hypothetical protein
LEEDATVTLKGALRSIVLSWDFWAALLAAGLMSVLVGSPVTMSVARDLFGVSITALSIIFSVFFAALAVLITSGDNEFYRFMHQHGFQRRIMWSFKVTLLLLFVSLVAAMCLYILASPDANDPQRSALPYPALPLVAFGWLAFYALFAAISSCLDAIKYAEYREKFSMLHAPTAPHDGENRSS